MAPCHRCGPARPHSTRSRESRLLGIHGEPIGGYDPRRVAAVVPGGVFTLPNKLHGLGGRQLLRCRKLRLVGQRGLVPVLHLQPGHDGAAIFTLGEMSCARNPPRERTPACGGKSANAPDQDKRYFESWWRVSDESSPPYPPIACFVAGSEAQVGRNSSRNKWTRGRNSGQQCVQNWHVATGAALVGYRNLVAVRCQNDPA